MEKRPDLSGMSYAALKAVIDDAADDVGNAKAWYEAVRAEVTTRLAPSAKAALDQQGKDTGTVRLPLQDGIEAKAEIGKTVKWDSDDLLAIAQTMPWDRVRGLFKMSFSVPENTYKAIRDIDPDLATKLDKARTVIIGEPKITLEKA